MGQMENHWQRIQHTSLLPKFKPANVFPIQILKLTMNLSLCLHWKWLAIDCGNYKHQPDQIAKSGIGVESFRSADQ